MRKIKTLQTMALALLAPLSAQADSSGVEIVMWGYPDNTAAYAFAAPTFLITNTSNPGIDIVSFSMDDGSYTNGLWDSANAESASTGIAYTLTQGDHIQDSGWTTYIGYSFTGFGAGGTMQFHGEPDTLHYGTGNAPDARPYLFNGGTITVGFSNGESLSLIWPTSPPVYSLDPLPRPDLLATDNRNIYYVLAGSVAVPVPEPETWAMLLAGLGLVGFAARRRHS
jgi:hypothetical protein